jgi:hypothetical protein
MALAANELKKPQLSTGAGAEAVGYQSEAAARLQEPYGRDPGALAEDAGGHGHRACCNKQR